MSHTRPFIAKLMIVSLLVSPAGPVAGWQAVAAAQSVKAVPPADGGWPRAYTTASGSRVVLYQPQVGLWPEQKHMTMGAAVSYQRRTRRSRCSGTLKIEVDTKVALDERLVSFSEFKITQANFPNICRRISWPPSSPRSTPRFPREERVIGLDRVLAMVDTSAIVPRNVAGRQEPIRRRSSTATRRPCS